MGEIWPEKKNVVIVGSNETSIPLYCNGVYGRCALEDKKTSTLIDILPGKIAQMLSSETFLSLLRTDTECMFSFFRSPSHWIGRTLH